MGIPMCQRFYMGDIYDCAENTLYKYIEWVGAQVCQQKEGHTQVCDGQA